MVAQQLIELWLVNCRAANVYASCVHLFVGRSTYVYQQIRYQIHLVLFIGRCSMVALYAYDTFRQNAVDAHYHKIQRRKHLFRYATHAVYLYKAVLLYLAHYETKLVKVREHHNLWRAGIAAGEAGYHVTSPIYGNALSVSLHMCLHGKRHFLFVSGRSRCEHKLTNYVFDIAHGSSLSFEQTVYSARAKGRSQKGS